MGRGWGEMPQIEGGGAIRTSSCGSNARRASCGRLCFVAGLALLTLVVGAAPWPARAAERSPIQYIFLVQNSGWMEPFYSDHRSEKFDPAVSAFIERAAPRRAPIVIASFNKAGEISGQDSPAVVYRGENNPDAVIAAIGRIDLSRRKDGRLANSDYREALVATIKDILHADSSVIYMITNNKSAPSGDEHPEDGPVAARTEAFNKLLKTSPAISRIVAWPLRFPAHGRLFDERGLVIYGIAYGKAASAPLRALSQSATLRAMLSDPPVQLKPIGVDPLLLHLAAGRRGDLSWYADRRGNLIVKGLSSGGDVVEMLGALRSTLYPYVIDSARILGEWTPAAGFGARASVSIVPSTIQNLAPLSSVANVRIALRLSQVERQHVFQDQADIPGTLSIRLVNLKLGLSPAFAQKMHDLFGAGAAPRPDIPDSLPPQAPRIFINYTEVSQASTSVPLTLGVSFFPWPLIGVILLLVAIAALIGGAVWMFTHPRPFEISIDGEPRTIALRPMQSREIQGMRERYIVSRAAFGPPTVKPKTV